MLQTSRRSEIRSRAKGIYHRSLRRGVGAKVLAQSALKDPLGAIANCNGWEHFSEASNVSSVDWHRMEHSRRKRKYASS